MNKFRYYADLGAGYVLVDVFDNELKLSVSPKFSSIIETKTLNGSVSFVGQLAKDLYDERTSSYKIPFKIEEYNGSVWSTLHECYADIRGDYRRLSRVLTATSFTEFEKPETKLAELMKNEYHASELGLTKYSLTQNIESTFFDVFSAPTGATPAAWQGLFNIEGSVSSTGPGPPERRWAYFFFVGTTGVSPSWIHQWRCNSFEFQPGEIDGDNGYFKEFVSGSNLWLKTTIITDPLDNFPIVLSRINYRLDDILNRLVSKLDLSLTFDKADLPSLEADKQYIGETNEFNAEQTGAVTLSLAKLFHIIRHYYATDWYIDSNKLKFRFQPLSYTEASADWSSETGNVDNISFADEPLPDRELFGFLDPNRQSVIKIDTAVTSSFPYARFTISYFQKGIPTELNIKDWRVDFYSDLIAVKQGNAEKDKGIWFRHDGADIKPLDCRDLYFQNDGGATYGGANYERYAEFNPIFYIDTVIPSNDYTSIFGANSDVRPIYEMKHNKWLNDYVAFKLLNEITFSGGNVGRLNNYDINLKTGNAIFYIRFKTIIL